jgi:hypothetical protein
VERNKANLSRAICASEQRRFLVRPVVCVLLCQPEKMKEVILQLRPRASPRGKGRKDLKLSFSKL